MSLVDDRGESSALQPRRCCRGGRAGGAHPSRLRRLRFVPTPLPQLTAVEPATRHSRTNSGCRQRRNLRPYMPCRSPHAGRSFLFKSATSAEVCSAMFLLEPTTCVVRQRQSAAIPQSSRCRPRLASGAARVAGFLSGSHRHRSKRSKWERGSHPRRGSGARQRRPTAHRSWPVTNRWRSRSQRHNGCRLIARQLQFRVGPVDWRLRGRKFLGRVCI